MELRGQEVGQRQDALPCWGGHLPAGQQDGVLLRPTGRRWGPPSPYETGTCLTRPGAVASLSAQAVRPGKEASLSVASSPPTMAELRRGPPRCVYR